MNVQHMLHYFRPAASFLGNLPACAVFVYLGLIAVPLLALIDVFVDFPPGDQDWAVYLMYWPATMLFSALIGLIADGFERLLSKKGRRHDV